MQPSVRVVVALVAVLFLCVPQLALAEFIPELTEAQQQRATKEIIEHHSFSVPILKDFTGIEMPHWTIGGSTVVTDYYVRLTGDQPSQIGHLWNRHPLTISDFEIVFGVFVAKKTNGADGLALWVAENPPAVNKPLITGQLFGQSNTFKGFGIILDTYDNNGLRDNPTIGLVVNDGTTTRTFSPQNDFHDDYIASCIFDFRSPSATRHFSTVRVVVGDSGSISVYVSKGQEANEQHCFTAHGVSINVKRFKYYIGLTAETGVMFQPHDVVFLHTIPKKGVTYDSDVHVLVEEEEDELFARDSEEEKSDPTTDAPRSESPPPAESSSPSEKEPSTLTAAPSPTPVPSAAPTPPPTATADLEELKKLQAELEKLKKLTESSKKKPKRAKRKVEYEEEEEEEDADEEEEEEEEEEEHRTRPLRAAKRRRRTTRK